MFKIWMKLLINIPGSVLWLMKLNDSAEQNLNDEAKKFGIDPNRIVYATRVPKIEDHLARYRLADLFLDTYPYNGHTTLYDALITGIDILSIKGKNFQSLVASSIINDFKLSNNYIANNLDEYYSKALSISKNKKLHNILTCNNDFLSFEKKLKFENYIKFQNILFNI
jgi:predicted O-linked N-acetylglucosamine transferase (SPINDLY family)